MSPVDVSLLRSYRWAVSDNRRWERFECRPGDIFVCTPPKCGTTWMQTIVASLIWPDGDVPGQVMTISPWIDANFFPIDEILARLEAQSHRRFIKSHTPADGIPWFDRASYIVVGRDGRDAFMSLCNHFEHFKGTVRQELNARAAADGVPPMPLWDGDVHRFFGTWLKEAAMFQHIASFWRHQGSNNLAFVHYNDLKADLAGEMRRLAAFLGIEVPASNWSATVERCTFESMRARDDEIGSFWNFEGGAQSFLFKGTNGRWRDVLRADELAAYTSRSAELLPADAAAWLEGGRAALARSVA
jgi:aryl sulfotransferase